MSAVESRRPAVLAEAVAAYRMAAAELDAAVRGYQAALSAEADLLVGLCELLALCGPQAETQAARAAYLHAVDGRRTAQVRLAPGGRSTLAVACELAGDRLFAAAAEAHATRGRWP